MSNITLAIDDDIVKKVRKLAVERNTSLTGLVRATLKQLAAREDIRTSELINELDQAFDTCSLKVGHKTWKREDLHAL